MIDKIRQRFICTALRLEFIDFLVKTDYKVCLEKVRPLLTYQEWFVQHHYNLAAKEIGLECTCVNSDNLTVLVSGGGRHF